MQSPLNQMAGMVTTQSESKYIYTVLCTLVNRVRRER